MSSLAFLRQDLKKSTDLPGKLAVTLFRLSQAFGPFGVVFTMLLFVLCGVSMPRTVKAGPGLRIAHGGQGLVVHPKTVIGSGCVLYHGVTLGVSGPDQGAPVLEDRVYVGNHASVLGGVRLGFRSRVGAHSLVLSGKTPTVPDFSTAVGSPAHVIERSEAKEWAKV